MKHASTSPSLCDLAAAWDVLAWTARAQGDTAAAQAYERCRRDLIDHLEPPDPPGAHPCPEEDA